MNAATRLRKALQHGFDSTKADHAWDSYPDPLEAEKMYGPMRK